ncbi:DUF2194 domain-containing protein [Paenibacillus pinistramenti]|uniref:DUF2194 domain-containing protein n=1 Tax=Paenibacillus pinistramenti TaxID=1768003 RepID=UPI0013969081|nr:DUF2194 domain-containing protein [Paenibacillus pinistramenti]
MKLNPRIYIILAGIVLIGAVLILTHTRYFQQFSHNRNLQTKIAEWKNEPPAAPNVTGAKFCVIYDGEDDYNVRIQEQAQRVLTDMRKAAVSVDLRKETLNLSGCGAVISALTDLTLVKDPDTLAGYLDQGGHLFLATMPEQSDAFLRLYRKFGIIDAGDYSDEQGIHLKDEVLLGEKGLEIDDEFMTNTVMQVELDPSAQVHATATSGMPLLWSYDTGKGSVMVFNGTMLQEKINRGIITGAVSMMMPDFIYPIYNSKLMYIDDWPAPYGSSIDPDIYKIYQLNRQEFFKQIWWPDMLKAAKRYGLKFTAVLIESYHNQVVPPFASPSDADPESLISYGREIIKSGGEIGLHGYNHQSLTTDPDKSSYYDYETWNSTSDMALSVQEALSYFKRSFPNYSLFTYVPPSNVLDPGGREALKQSWNNLAVISSVFAEDAAGISYVQEFEQAKDGILEMPRVTSGYDDEAFERWTAASVLTSYGFFSHFVHPDDVLDSERSMGMTWEELYKNYSTVMSRLQKNYPWLQAKTATEAAIDMKNLLSSDIELSQSGDVIKGKVTPLQGEASFILRTRKTAANLSGCTVKKIGDGILLVTVTKSEFTIHLSEA